jgi:dTDP-4-amino-4,6-dideoxygalactose transaminase
MVAVFVDVDEEDFAIKYKYIIEKTKLKRKERYVHVASTITAAIADRTKAIMVAQHTNKQSRRIERFLNYIKIKS